MELQVIPGPQVHLASRDRSADKAGQDPKVSQGHEDLRVIKEIRVLERWEMLDLQEHQVSQARQAMARWDPQVQLASRVFLGSQDLLDSLVQKETMAGVILQTV